MEADSDVEHAIEAPRGSWSVRQLERQIGAQLFERLARYRRPDEVLALARRGQEVGKPRDVIKDPFVLEFLDLGEPARLRERNVAQAIGTRTVPVMPAAVQVYLVERLAGIQVTDHERKKDVPAMFTARQGEYLAFIHSYTTKVGVSPSFEDIGRHFGTAPPNVNGMIKTLEKARLVEPDSRRGALPSRARSRGGTAR